MSPILLIAAAGAALLTFLLVERRWFLLGSLLRRRFREPTEGPGCVVVQASGPGANSGRYSTHWSG